MGSTIITSVIGFFFWWLAARKFSPEAVGLGSATIATMMLLGTAGILGFGTFLIGELPRRSGNEKSLISTALITVGISGMALGVIFAILAPGLSPDLRVLSETYSNIALFSAGICLTAMALVLDQALIGLLRGDIQFRRNIIVALGKLGALFLAGQWLTNRSGLIIYGAWALGNLLSFVAIASQAFSKDWDLHAYLPRWGLLRNHGRSALGHHALNLSLLAPGLVLPILVTVLMSVRMNAYFYTAWMIANLAFIGPVALTTVLYAVVSADRASLVPKTRLTLKLSLLIGLVASGVLVVGSDSILRFFGATYAQEAVWSLRVLSLGVFPIIIRNHYVAIYRIFNRIVSAARVMALCAVFELVLAAIGAKMGGLTGLSLGWLAAVCVEAILMAGTVLQVAASGELAGAHLSKHEIAPPQIGGKGISGMS